ncbi:alpha/beta hydrolase [Haloferula sp. A504]|uniref:alpha/beta hydrolase n=1 Tax=Haloferula sp. A504 TaxID=3373601 RepID=UPI0031BC8BBB|nr:alpha/beta hydrolase [Verrucomicrobiaceae bacterium E54]
MSIRKARSLIPCLLVLAAPAARAYDVPGFTPDQTIPYKQTVNSTGGAVTLNLHVFTPEGHQASDSRPVIVFFFGGGWVDGSPTQFHPHCEYLASRGMVAISAEYRVKNVHGTTPQECVKDGKSAVRYLRENAASLGIDPNRIAAGGGSAGGHVAAATGTLTAYEEPGENLAVSSKPNAMVLFNPVYDNSVDGYGYSTVQAYWEDISPLHNIDSTTPPTVVFLGTSDNLIPVATAESFQALMEAEGIRSDLHLYQGQPHGFFNYEVPDDGSGPWYGYQATVFRTDGFLVSLGYLPDPHAAPDPVTGWVTIFGDADFSGGSEATSSPVTTDGNTDSIAANIDPVALADGDFIRLAGSVTFDVPIPAGHFRIGLFDSDDPVTAGDGSGYAGIWAETPSTSAAKIAAGDGTGASSPFESVTAIELGPMPAAEVQVAANTPMEFTLMIARNGDALDITADFADDGSFSSEQNLLNQALADYDYNSVAFLMTGILNASQGSYSGIGVTRGRVLSDPVEPPPAGPIGLITYVDAAEGSGGNTFVTGGTPADTSWMVVDVSSTDDDQWSKRTTVEGNGGTLFQAMPNGSPDLIPELTTRLSGLADGDYELYAFYWDQIDSDTQNWVLSAGLTSGVMTAYSSPGEPAVAGATATGVNHAADLSFADPAPAVVAGGGLRKLFGIHLGRGTVSGGSAVDVRIDLLLNGSSTTTRAWFDGVGYARANTFRNWISGYDAGNEPGFDDDPDGDGRANGLENFFGTDPVVADAAGLNPVSLNPQSGTFTHPQSEAPAEDLVVTYQWSDNLSTFLDHGETNAAGTRVTFSSQTHSPAPGTTTVIATISGPMNPDHLFFRLKVLQSNP